jgi:tRNA modification GTPase
VGKSCLFNALAGFPRAIVDQEPGTTRDVVTFRASLGGWPVELADTAGVRGTEDAVESLGIYRSRREQARADLLLLVLDRSEPLQVADRELIALSKGALLLANKSDLPAAWTSGDADLERSELVTISAQRGDGMGDLTAAIINRLVPDPPAPGAAVPFRAAHLDDLTRVRARLAAGDRARAAERLRKMSQLGAGGGLGDPAQV